MDLLSLILTLSPLDLALSHPTPRWWGRAAHALLFNVVAQANPALAGEMHDDQGLRPFTASTLIGRFPNHGLDPAKPYSLRFTALSQAITTILLNAIQPGGLLTPGAAVQLDETRFQVQAVTWDASTNSWAGATSYQELGAAHLLAATPAPRKVIFQFSSPTGFHSNERMMPWPLPEMVFTSLADRWNTYASISFPAEIRRYAAECLAIERFDLSSRAIPTKGGGVRVGAVGSVTYATLNYDRYWMSLVHTLAAYAIYAGVGHATAQGMGQCRSMDEKKDASPNGEAA
jgi:CRISPR-associated endoribonuclease Cas6